MPLGSLDGGLRIAGEALSFALEGRFLLSSPTLL